MDLPRGMLLACSLCLLPGKQLLPLLQGGKNREQLWLLWVKRWGKPKVNKAAGRVLLGEGGREPGGQRGVERVGDFDGLLGGENFYWAPQGWRSLGFPGFGMLAELPRNEGVGSSAAFQLPLLSWAAVGVGLFNGFLKHQMVWGQKDPPGTELDPFHLGLASETRRWLAPEHEKAVEKTISWC